MALRDIELHMTVNPTDEAIANAKRFSLWTGYKFTHIMNESGTSFSQPMLTKRFKTDSVPNLISNIDRYLHRMAGSGFEVTRIKMECDPNLGIEGIAGASSLYYEHHIKVKFRDVVPFDLQRILRRHNAKLSQNIAKVFPEGTQEKFVTQRAYGGTFEEAKILFDALYDELFYWDYTVIEREQELVIYDNNLQLDEGWI